MALKIPVAHDFICPWCWIALSQADRLRKEFDVEFEWLSYELMPEGMAWPEPTPPSPLVPNKPTTPSRLDLALAAEGMPFLTVARPGQMQSRKAHLAVEYAKTEGKGEELLRALYEELYLRGATINDLDVIERAADKIVENLNALRLAVEQESFADKIICFDNDAYASGVFHVPTFFIGDARYAEQPYSVLRDAVSKVAERQPNFWRGLKFPQGPKHRPFTAIVMAITLDGTVAIQGQPFVGTKNDQHVLQTVEEQFEASIAGAETARQAPRSWHTRAARSFILSRSGNLPADSEYVRRSEVLNLDGPANLNKWLASLKTQGVQKLLIEGGPRVNRQFLEIGAVDELFLTLTPTISMGRTILPLVEPTLDAFPPLRLELIEGQAWGDEWFGRYRVLRP